MQIGTNSLINELVAAPSGRAARRAAINPSGFQFFGEKAAYIASTGGEPDSEVILQINERYGVYPVEGAH